MTTSINVLKNIYPVDCIIKAAAIFINSAYVHIDEDEKNWIITFTSKDGQDLDNIPQVFENELLSQAIRFRVYKNTKNIREMLLARAISTSMVDNEDKKTQDNESNVDISEDELQDILQDWFQKDGK